MEDKERHVRIIGKIFIIVGTLILVLTSFSFNFIHVIEEYLAVRFEDWSYSFGIFTMNHPPFGLLYFIPIFYLILSTGTSCHNKRHNLRSKSLEVTLFRGRVDMIVAIQIWYSKIPYDHQMETLPLAEKDTIPFLCLDVEVSQSWPSRVTRFPFPKSSGHFSKRGELVGRHQG